MKILISRCLLGEPCRYDGQSRPVPAIQQLEEAGHVLIPVCPEVAGGLATPRPPAERQKDGRVVNEAGEDVTEAYRKGAELAVTLARKYGCQAAILKAKSPSCGSGTIYDGTFSRSLVSGWGVAAEQLRMLGLTIVDENGWQALLNR